MSDDKNDERAATESGQTVYVVDDDPAIRDSAQFLLESAGLPSRGFGSAEEFLEATDQEELRGCLILDVRMGGMSGLDLQRELNDRGISLPVIIVTGHSDVPMAVQAMRLGAFDLVEKPYSDQLLLERIREALDRDASVQRESEELSTVKKNLATLSPREREVMELVVAGYLNKQIAAKLELSIKTIEVHRSRVMQKMEARSLAALVRMAMAAGMEVGLV